MLLRGARITTIVSTRVLVMLRRCSRTNFRSASSSRAQAYIAGVNARRALRLHRMSIIDLIHLRAQACMHQRPRIACTSSVAIPFVITRKLVMVDSLKNLKKIEMSYVEQKSALFLCAVRIQSRNFTKTRINHANKRINIVYDFVFSHYTSTKPWALFKTASNVKNVKFSQNFGLFIFC